MSEASQQNLHYLRLARFVGCSLCFASLRFARWLVFHKARSLPSLTHHKVVGASAARSTRRPNQQVRRPTETQVQQHLQGSPETKADFLAKSFAKHLPVLDARNRGVWVIHCTDGAKRIRIRIEWKYYNVSSVVDTADTLYHVIVNVCVMSVAISPPHLRAHGSRPAPCGS